MAPRIADQWEKAVVLRLGRFRGLKGPGLFWVVPFVDRVVGWIDLRIRTTGFAAEKTLTEDTVPINVDTVLFWVVTDAEKAALQPPVPKAGLRPGRSAQRNPRTDPTKGLFRDLCVFFAVSAVKGGKEAEE